MKLPPVTVGTPILPDPDQLAPLLAGIWARGRLTNCGPLHERLQSALTEALGVPCAALTGSGTQALMLALMLGQMRGHLAPGAEVVTTPLSFAASAGVIAAMGFRPVFADICPDRLTLDPAAVAAAITPRTGAVLSVHLYGAIADENALAALARRHGLWLIHDAAHGYGVRLNGRGIGTLGDVSAFSLHATKLLNTAEGGVLTTPRRDDAGDLARLRNFGLEGRVPTGPGLNAKLSEPHAAIGLAMWDRAQAEATARLALRSQLDALVDAAPGLARPALHPGQTVPLLYYPVMAADAAARARLIVALGAAGIGAQAYFPLLCGAGRPWPMADVPVAQAVADRILCLPCHSGVTRAHLDQMARICADA